MAHWQGLGIKLKPIGMRLPINGVSLQVHTWGNAKNPPILFVHGWLDTGASLQWVSEILQDRYFLIAPDMRGFGKSGPAPSELGYFFFEYVADVFHLINRFSSDEPMHLVGHSLGGAIVSAVAGSFPEKIKSLVNVEGFGFQRIKKRTPSDRIRDWLGGLPPSPFPIYDSLKPFLKNLAKKHPRIPVERLEQWGQLLVNKTAKGFQVSADPKHKVIEPYEFSQDHFNHFWKELRSPALFIVAEKSELVPLYQEVSPYFPESVESAVVPNCGHMVHLEDPVTLARLMGDFYERVS